MNVDKPDHPPSPVYHGWTLENGKCQPLRYTKAPLPERFEIFEAERDDDDDDSASDTNSSSGSDSDQEDEVSEDESEKDFA